MLALIFTINISTLHGNKKHDKMKKTKLVKFVAAGEHVKHQKEGKGKILPGILPKSTIETTERYISWSL